MKPRRTQRTSKRAKPAVERPHRRARCRSKSPSTAAHFWRAWKARPSLFRSLCPANRRAFASPTTSAATPLPRPKRSSPPRPNALHPPAATSALAAAATISTRTMRHNSPSSKPSCAKRWSAPACKRRKKSPCLPPKRNRNLGLSQSHPPGLRCPGKPRLSRPPLSCGRSHPRVPYRSAAAGQDRQWRLAEVARQFRSALRLTEFSLFCDAGETSLLASLLHSALSAGKEGFDELRSTLAEQIPALKGVELVAESRGQEPHLTQSPRTVAQWGEPSLSYRAAGFDYRVDHGAFFQVNRWLVDAPRRRGHRRQYGNSGVGSFCGRRALRAETHGRF